MTGRHLVFVASVEDAPPPYDGVDVVVLDTAWTRAPADPPGPIPLRSIVGPILERIDLYRDALDRLEAWEAEAGIADRMTADGVSWWFRQRPFIWYSLHEHRLWLAILDALGARAAASIDIRADEPVLSAVAGALVEITGATLHTPEPLTTSAETAPPAVPTRTTPPARRPVVQRVLARLRPRPTAVRREQKPPDRGAAVVAMLDRRVEDLRRDAGRSVLVVSHPRVFQVITGDAGTRVVDPQLAPVMERLGERGMPLVNVALDLDPRRDEHRGTIEADDRLLPDAYIRRRWASDDPAEPAAATVLERLIAARGIPLDVDGVDLAPVLLGRLEHVAGAWLIGQLRLTRAARRMFDDLKPAAMFLNHEGIRTPWLAAARGAGVPIHAVQHGIIYPTHPVYRHGRDPGLVYPERTNVYGPYERTVLLECGAYEPDEVEVTGSPRLDVVDADAGRRAASRAEVRRSLGVTDGDRMLVLSTANHVLAWRFHIADAMGRILDGPLPGVHLVIKLHPGEQDEGPYRALIEGLARAGGYPAPPITIVHDIDLFRLLAAADAHLGFHSTVLTDAVAAGTPNLLAAGHATADLLGYVDAGVVQPVRDIAELRAALDDPRPPDDHARRMFIERHFRAGDASDRIAAGIADSIGREQQVLIALRPATTDDESMLLGWANDPTTRAAGFSPAEIGPDEHHHWLASVLGSPADRLLIGMRAKEPVGQVRLDRDDAGRVEVGISVAPEVRGQGIGRALLAAALEAGRDDDELAATGFVARIRPENAASIALFEGAGFRLATSTEVDGMACLVYKRAVEVPVMPA
jgi:RimJ/RimL family protein N-acetyltransferase